MAWIKMRTDLRNDPAVIGIMAITGLDECGVLGRLYRIWAWADSVSEDGTVAHLSPVRFASYMDRELAADGFVQAMHEVGWLRIDGDRVSFPNYDRHMSQSAKKRSADAVRKAEERVRETSGKKRTNVRKRSDEKRTREEKSREEKNTDSLRESGSAKRGNDTWLTPFGDAWRARYGGELAWSRAGSAFSPLREEHGAERVLRAWVRYVAATEAQFASPQRFASTFGQWDGTAPPAERPIDARGAARQNVPAPAAPDPEFRARYEASMRRRRAPRCAPEAAGATISCEVEVG